ncbi:MAG: GTPase [archaeon]
MVRVRYSFSSRRTRHTKKIKKQRAKFPALALEIVQRSDIILEVLDSRFIADTRNLELEELIKKQGKQIIFVLNKSDLIEKLNELEIADLDLYVSVSCNNRNGIQILRNRIKIVAKKVEKTEDEKVTVGILGYPNTGKSSLINLLIGKKSAGTGAEPGFTKGIQKLKLSPEIMLLDSPGVIPRKHYSSIRYKFIARHTKVGARSYSKVKDPEMVIDYLVKEYPGKLEAHYQVQTKGDSELLLEELGKKWNILKKGGIVDTDKTARKVLKHWQTGEIKV